MKSKKSIVIKDDDIKKLLKKYNPTDNELEEVLDEMISEIKSEIKNMTPAQRKKDKEESKKWVVEVKHNKNSSTITAKKVK